MLSLRDSFVSVDVLLYIGYISSLDFSRFQQMQFHFSFRLHTELFGCCWDKTKKKRKNFFELFVYCVRPLHISSSIQTMGFYMNSSFRERSEIEIITCHCCGMHMHEQPSKSKCQHAAV